MKAIKGLFEAVLAQWGVRMQRHGSADRAAGVAYRIAMNGCRL